MNPRLKKLIIIANIAVYVVVCLGIYAKRKGGFKALLPRKKVSLEEAITRTRKGSPAPATPVEKAPAEVEKKVAPTAKEIATSEFPIYVRDARTLLENMRIKEQALKFNYYSLNRDPFVSLIGIENYLSQIKFTADEYANLPPGLPVKEKQKSSPFTLFGTIKSKDGESAAIINNQVLQKGDVIDGYTVTKIEKKSVTLTSGRKVIYLKM